MNRLHERPVDFSGIWSERRVWYPNNMKLPLVFLSIICLLPATRTRPSIFDVTRVIVGVLIVY